MNPKSCKIKIVSSKPYENELIKNCFLFNRVIQITKKNEKIAYGIIKGNKMERNVCFKRVMYKDYNMTQFISISIIQAAGLFVAIIYLEPVFPFE